MHLSSLPGLQKSDAELVDEFILIFEVRSHVISTVTVLDSIVKICSNDEFILFSDV